MRDIRPEQIHVLNNFVPLLWQWLTKKKYISFSFSIFFYYYLKKVLTTASETGKKIGKNSRYAVSRYAVTSLPVTPLRVLLTTNFL